MLESKNLNPTQGFEHVKGNAGFAAGKPRVCSENVSFSHMIYLQVLKMVMFHGYVYEIAG